MKYTELIPGKWYSYYPDGEGTNRFWFIKSKNKGHSSKYVGTTSGKYTESGFGGGHSSFAEFTECRYSDVRKYLEHLDEETLKKYDSGEQYTNKLYKIF